MECVGPSIGGRGGVCDAFLTVTAARMLLECLHMLKSKVLGGTGCRLEKFCW